MLGLHKLPWQHDYVIGLSLREENKDKAPVRLFYSAFNGMSDHLEAKDSVTPGGTPTITKSTWKTK